MARHNGIVRRNTSTTLEQQQESKDSTRKVALEESEAEWEVRTVRSSDQKILWRTETSLSDNDDEDDLCSVDESTTSEANETTSNAEEFQKKQSVEVVDSKTGILAKQETYTVVRDEKDGSVFVEVGVEKYMAKRQMTPLQERMNALTMIPPPLYCLCFIMSGNWISQTLIREAQKGLDSADFTASDNDICLDWASSSVLGRIFRHLHAIPPLPVVAYAIGVMLHAPFSFLYHWKYAHVLSPGKRTIHWSRRMDQSMLHVCSALTSFATAGAWNFFLVNAIFNADSIYRQFQQEVRPPRNQRRLGIAIFAWTLPILKRGDTEIFLKILSILAFGMFLFVKYPVGGWSHSAFHLVMFPLMPLLMEVAVGLPSSQEHLKEAAQCYALAERRMIS